MSRQGSLNPVSRHGLPCRGIALRPGTRPDLGTRDRHACVVGTCEHPWPYVATERMWVGATGDCRDIRLMLLCHDKVDQ